MSDAFTHQDLSRYRVVYAAVMLLMLPQFAWVAEYPDSLFRPPPGLMSLVDGFPPEWVLVTMEVGLACSLAALLTGVRVGFASIVTTLLMVVGLGYSYSLGKIDHTWLAVFAPVFLLGAGWSGTREPRPWVMRLLAWTIAVAFFTAGAPKLLAGWLDPTSHATQGFFLHSYYNADRDGWLAGLLLNIQTPWFWEPLDWLPVALELGLVVLALSRWPAWRVGVALLALFHLGVLLLLNINYSTHVLVYAAFISWGRLRWPPPLRLPMAWCVAPIGLTAWGVARWSSATGDAVGALVLLLGGVGAFWYLLRALFAAPSGDRWTGGSLPRAADRDVLHR